MDEKAFQEQFASLLDRINGLPERERCLLGRLVDESKSSGQVMSESLVALESSLDYLRLCVNYLVFDLEATRRENECLRRLLADSESNSGEAADEDHESFWDDTTD